jgi:hypothetical protein
LIAVQPANPSGYTQNFSDDATRGLAGRLGALIAGENGGDLRHAAERLGVAEVDLCHLLECRAPVLGSDHLAELCAAAVRHYGVDPSWLVTGCYDPDMHRDVEEYPRSATGLRRLIADLIRKSRPVPVAASRYSPLPDVVWGVVAPDSDSAGRTRVAGASGAFGSSRA